jgi:hypothetical protein
LSRRNGFYEDIGFAVGPGSHEPAILYYGPCGSEHVDVCFLLQNHYIKEFAEHWQMHLLVKDADAWWEMRQARQIARKYGIEALPPQNQPWKMRDIELHDPSGVLWRISQQIN